MLPVEAAGLLGDVPVAALIPSLLLLWLIVCDGLQQSS